MTFTGVSRTADEIPSKAFQRLQNLTGGAEIDTTSIRPSGKPSNGSVMLGCDVGVMFRVRLPLRRLRRLRRLLRAVT